MKKKPRYVELRVCPIPSMNEGERDAMALEMSAKLLPYILAEWLKSEQDESKGVFTEVPYRCGNGEKNWGKFYRMETIFFVRKSWGGLRKGVLIIEKVEPLSEDGFLDYINEAKRDPDFMFFGDSPFPDPIEDNG